MIRPAVSTAQAGTAGTAAAGIPRVEVFGLEFPLLCSTQAQRYVLELAGSGRRRVYFANAHTLNLSWGDPDFRRTLRSGDVTFNDGSGIFVAGLMKGRRFPSNLCGTDLVPALFPEFAARDWPVFLLGSRPRVIAAAARNLKQTWPELPLVGFRSGYFASPEDETELFELLHRLSVRVLLVGMGQPLQERWLERNLERLPDPILCFGVGGFFDIYSGRLHRPPRIVRRIGMEWTWRLLQQPRYVAGRYLIGNPVFLSRAARNALGHAPPEAAPHTPVQPSGGDVGAAVGAPCVELFGLQVDAVRPAAAVARVDAAITAGRPYRVITPNVDFAMLARRSPDLYDLFNASDLRVCDSMPFVWMSRALGRPLPERVNGTDLFELLLEVSARRGWSVFFFGGAPPVLDRLVQVVRERHPTLRIVGAETPRLGFEKRPEENDALLGRIRDAAPDLVFVALGTPKQECWIAAVQPRLPPCVFMGVGASFDFVSGMKARAPRWMQSSGLEWLHRLILEPRRMAPRYLWRDLPVLGLFLRDFWAGKKRGGAPSAARGRADSESVARPR